MTEAQQEWYDSFNGRKRNFEMFKAAGNAKCQSIARTAIRKVFGVKKVTQEQLENLIGTKINEAYTSGKFKEICDSEPPRNIAHYVNLALVKAGYGFEVDHYNFSNAW